MENMFFFVKIFLLQKKRIGLRGHGGAVFICIGQILMILWPFLCEFSSYFYINGIYICFDSFIELEEGCYHAKGMSMGGTLWYDLVTLTLTHDLELTFQGQRFKNACDPSKRSLEPPECENNHFRVVTLKYRSRSSNLKLL